MVIIVLTGVCSRSKEHASVQQYEERLLTMQREFDEMSASNHTLLQQQESMRNKMYVLLSSSGRIDV